MVKIVLCVSLGSVLANLDNAEVPSGQLNSTADVPYLRNLGQECFSACYGVTGKCPSTFCGSGGWCCRWGVEWDTRGCYHVGCHGKHCCVHRGHFLEEAADATDDGQAVQDQDPAFGRDGHGTDQSHFFGRDGHGQHNGQDSEQVNVEHSNGDDDSTIVEVTEDKDSEQHLETSANVPYFDHLGQDCWKACYHQSGKCPSTFCGSHGHCCRWGIGGHGCNHVGCHHNHCCVHPSHLEEAANATAVMV